MKLYELAKDREKELWEKAVFVYDTSSILNIYSYSENARDAILEKVWGGLKGRLWVPYQVFYEYIKNRKNVIREPIAFYEKIIEKHLEEIRHQVTEMKKKTERTKGHPRLEQGLLQGFEKQFADFEEQVYSEKDRHERQIEELVENDPIEEAFEERFQVGREYSYRKIMDIIEEGKTRYEFQIPPGYKDRDSKKAGFQIFGDLILWKQILDFASRKKKPVIFISDDMKRDWWRIGRKTRTPRDELVKEMKDETGVDFWMYPSLEFYENAKKLLDISLPEEVLSEIENMVFKEDWWVAETKEHIRKILGAVKWKEEKKKAVFRSGEEYEEFNNRYELKRFLKDRAEKIFEDLVPMEKGEPLFKENTEEWAEEALGKFGKQIEKLGWR